MKNKLYKSRDKTGEEEYNSEKKNPEWSGETRNGQERKEHKWQAGPGKKE